MTKQLPNTLNKAVTCGNMEISCISMTIESNLHLLEGKSRRSTSISTVWVAMGRCNSKTPRIDGSKAMKCWNCAKIITVCQKPIQSRGAGAMPVKTKDTGRSIVSKTRGTQNDGHHAKPI